MAQTLEVKRYGGTVTFSATSDPNPPILTFSSTGNTWASRNGEVITIAANNSASDRSFDITVTATTSANTSYDGIASAYSAYTITQEGTGTTPTGTYELVITLRSDVVSISAEQVDFALFEYNANGYTRVSDIVSFFADELPTASETIIDLTGLTSATTYQIMLRPVCSETGWCGSETDTVQCDYTYPIGGSGNNLGTGSIITDGSGDGWTVCGTKFTLSNAHSSNGVVIIELDIR